MTPTIGRIVHYTLSEADAEDINRRRADALRYAIGNDTGCQIHVGNPAAAGQVFPMAIVRVSEADGYVTAVNGQVMLDGNDLLWTMSITEGPEQGQWSWPPRVG